jgi:hypothetical protein
MGTRVCLIAQEKSREFGIKLGSNLFVFENPPAASSFGF